MQEGREVQGKSGTGIKMTLYDYLFISQLFDMLTIRLTSHTMVKLDPSYDCSRQ